MNTSSGLCECGCGRATTIATTTQRCQGRVKGRPIRFIHGHNRKRPLVERFWGLVEKADGCWLWRGVPNVTTGYGMFGITRKGRTRFVGAHRFSWQLAHGPIPPGLFVCHHCDVRHCVKPDHLFLGTAADNQADAASKDRIPYGTAHHNARLSEENAVLIRDLYARGGITHQELGRRFSVSYATIQRLLKGGTWRRAGGVLLPPARWNTVVTEDQVRAIRSRRAAGDSAMSLAKEYGTSDVNIRRIVNRTAWRHVP